MSDDSAAVVGSTKPYLMRAIYDWTLDQGLTPQIMVNVELAGAGIPKSYSKDGKIVLNLHPDSVRGLEIGNDFLVFSARFAGRAEDMAIPLESVMAVYSRENGQGIVFQADGSGITPPPLKDKKSDSKVKLASNALAGSRPNKAGSHLKVVK